MGLLEDLSAAFVAFTIEVDDGAEARRGAGKTPWLVSLAMWRNCMEWLPPEGMTVAELIATARTPTDINGMERWGYIELEGGTARPTRLGLRAQRLWDKVPAEIERLWAGRFGTAELGELRAALTALAGRLDAELPDTMPIVRHGWSTRRDEEPERRPGPVAVADLGLDSLLARPLTALALEYEASGKLSLALQANLIAVLGVDPTPLRGLPDATGIHRAQIDNAVGYLERLGLAEVVAAPGAKRGKAVALTARGERAKVSGRAKLAALEARWDERHGEAVARLRKALASIASADPGHPPGTWRAEAKPLTRLPRFPLVTHRGGFPDGA
jgi:DNA-binding MarR family transcriptional regulator